MTPLAARRAAASPGPVRSPFLPAVAEGRALSTEDTAVRSATVSRGRPCSPPPGRTMAASPTRQVQVIDGDFGADGLGAGTLAGFDEACRPGVTLDLSPALNGVGPLARGH